MFQKGRKDKIKERGSGKGSGNKELACRCSDLSGVPSIPVKSWVLGSTGEVVAGVSQALLSSQCNLILKDPLSPQDPKNTGVCSLAYTYTCMHIHVCSL